MHLITLLTFVIPVFAGLSDLAYCDPLAKDETCPPDPAFVSKALFDFNNAGWNNEFTSFWSIDADTEHDRKELDFVRNNNGLAIKMYRDHSSPTLSSHKYLLFGRVSVEVKAAKGPGVVTAIVLKSDSGDEIDWEMLGAFNNQAQTNYFYDGQALFNTYNTTYSLSSNSFDAFHLYTVEWTDEFLRFSIDNVVHKTWHKGDGSAPDIIPTHKWPQTPMQVEIGLWAVNGTSDDAGEIVWAGGVPDWDKNQPYTAYFNKVEVEDYKGWCEELNPGKVEYQYDERTKGWQDIKVLGCKKRRAPGVLSPENPKPHPSITGGCHQGSEVGGAAPRQTDEENDDASLAGMSATLAAIVSLGWLLF